MWAWGGGLSIKQERIKSYLAAYLLISEVVFGLQRASDHFHDGSPQKGVVRFALHQALEDVEIRLIDESFQNHDDRDEKLFFAMSESDGYVAVAGSGGINDAH